MNRSRRKGLSKLTGVLLAGGLGTRLRSVVSDRSKTMAMVHGRPFLTFLLDQLQAAGLKDVILCTGHLGQELRQELGQKYHGVRLHYSQEQSPLGTAGALKLALPLMASETALVLNGDSYCAAPLAPYWEKYEELHFEASLLLTKVADCSRYGHVETTPGGRVVRFEEKGMHTGPGWINAGMYLIDRQLLELIPVDRPVSLEREMLPQWIDRGVGAHQAEARFLDIGTPESYAETEKFFADLIRRDAA